MTKLALLSLQRARASMSSALQLKELFPVFASNANFFFVLTNT